MLSQGILDRLDLALSAAPDAAIISSRKDIGSMNSSHQNPDSPAEQGNTVK
jgi:hypothetical protein